MIELPYLSVARISGENAGEFLQAQLSADISVLEAGDSTTACYCSPRGQVIGLLLTGRDSDGFLAVAAAELLPAILGRLRMFVLRARVDFSLMTKHRVFGLPEAESLEDGAVFEPNRLGLRYLISDRPESGPDNPEDWKAAELGKRLCWLGSETTERFIPQMLGFDSIGAVSFSKGCYPGQEIIARARYLGRVKRRPLLLHTAENPGITPGIRVELQYGTGTVSATVVDSVLREDGVLLYLISPADSDFEVCDLTHENRSYRCATI